MVKGEGEKQRMSQFSLYIPSMCLCPMPSFFYLSVPLLSFVLGEFLTFDLGQTFHLLLGKLVNRTDIDTTICTNINNVNKMLRGCQPV